MCQDTGTAIIMGKKGRAVFTAGDDEAALAEGARDAYLKRNLRYSQLAPITMFEEKNTRSNMPAQVEIYAEGEDAYKFLFIAKGGGSANKAFLFQATPSILTHDRMLAFLKEKVLTLGTAACPPYHLAVVIGGTSAELTMKTVKLASTQLSRRAADKGQRGRACVSRSGDGKGSAGDDAGDRRRRAVRRQIFLPRRARDPFAAAWREPADRAGCVLRRRPAGARQDHQGRRVPRRARAQSGAVSARGRSGKIWRRGGQGRPTQADEGDSGAAVEISGEDAALAHRHHDRRPRSGARQIARAVGEREGTARLFQEPPDLLCRPREDACGLCLRRFRPDHGGADGQFHRPCSRPKAAR